MTLSETMLLLTLLATVAALLVDVAKAAFDIAWKISHDRKNDKNKKRLTAQCSKPDGQSF
ncbi:MAG: hypothetical protein UC771_05470 [Faecalibacterium sp.]|jgi:hypothetical protein|nr:hypothetical protein [Faecalibacterium sp.]